MAKNKNRGWHGYTVEDCGCEYCRYYGGKRSKKVVCHAGTCVCKEEREEAELRKKGLEVVEED